MRFTGHAALFDVRDAGRDIIRPGAFARTLAERSEPLPLRWQHRPDVRIGWIEEVREDDRGLIVVALIDNPQGAPAAALKAGKVTGLSFGFRARDFTRDDAGRELRAVDLIEVSLVTHPMQPGARVESISTQGDLDMPDLIQTVAQDITTAEADARAALARAEASAKAAAATVEAEAKTAWADVAQLVANRVADIGLVLAGGALVWVGHLL